MPFKETYAHTLINNINLTDDTNNNRNDERSLDPLKLLFEVSTVNLLTPLIQLTPPANLSYLSLHPTHQPSPLFLHNQTNTTPHDPLVTPIITKTLDSQTPHHHNCSVHVIRNMIHETLTLAQAPLEKTDIKQKLPLKL